MSAMQPAGGAGEDKKKKKSGRVRILFLGAAIFFGLPFSWFVWVMSYAFSAGPSPQPEVSTQQPRPGIFVNIPPNSGLFKIKRILVEKGVLKSDRRFRLTARLLDVTNKLKAGEYYITYGQSPYDILRDLEAGKVVQQTITIPEGSTMYQVADLLDEKGVVDELSFLALVKDASYIRKLGIEAESLEGYLFPDTYRLAHGQSADFVIRLMVKKMLGVLDEIGVDKGNNTPEWVEETYTRHEVLTIASIVEKETARGEERPLIARVFLNRLKRGMRLQTDPTVIYGIPNFDGNLRRKDLETPTPYNTYVIRGLPPGPIGNPGERAIRAVLHPSKESYLYFVSKNDGAHYFSKSLIEHNKAVMKYQKSRKYRRRRSNEQS